RYFSSAELTRAARFERFEYVLWALQVMATIVALAVLSRRSPRLVRTLGLGRVGSGVIVGMLMLVTLWLVQLPFGFLSQWWDARPRAADDRADARAARARERHARDRAEGQRLHERGECLLDGLRAVDACRPLGHVARRTLHARRGPLRARARARPHSAQARPQ